MTRMHGVIFVLLGAAGVAGAAAGIEQIVDFQSDAVGGSPKGFTIAQTGPGAAARWEVREDASSPSADHVLVQTSDDKTVGHRFPLAIYEGLRFADGAVAVRFKTISGEVDQAAGLVFRYHDPDNYYIVRANALEQNVVLYKVEKGKRSDLKPVDGGMFSYGKQVNVGKGRWQELRVEFSGQRFQVSLDGGTLFEVEDGTFSEPGQVGLWTKADSVTAFDGLHIESREQPTAR
ncbi:MAG: hypothetical protein E4H11_09020 [Myxococcales bacterium]|nr:MAG: hypothetical protein E4H11_09020 [Myxococcales bacterium]